MEKEKQWSGDLPQWEETLRDNGLLRTGERVLAFLEHGSVSDAIRGVVLTNSRVFSFSGSEIGREVAFEEVETAECRVRLRRTARYEFRVRDGSTESILLNGGPEEVDGFCRVLDQVCSDRFPGFEPKQAPAEEPAPEKPTPKKIERPPVSPKPPAQAKATPPPQPRDPGVTYRQPAFATSHPNIYSTWAFLLAVAGLLPVYGVVFAVAALVMLVYGRSADRRGDSQWDGPLRVVILVLAFFGLASFFAYRFALGFPRSLEVGRQAFSGSSPDILIARWEARAAIGVAILLFAASYHEAAHALVAYWNGDPTSAKLGRITLNPIAHIDLFGSILLPVFLVWSSEGRFFFAYARPVPVNPNRYRNLRVGYLTVSFAGPGANFLLAILAIWLHFLLASVAVLVHGAFEASIVAHPVWGTVFFLIRLFVLLNIFLGVFNMLPIPPLDGYHILQALLPWKWTEFLRPVERYGFFLLLILLLSGSLGGMFVVIQYLSDYREMLRGLFNVGSPLG
jgi:Zn-dependent protease